MKSVITDLLTTAFLTIASTAHASPATDIDHIRGVFAAKDLPAGVKTVEKSDGEEAWELTTLKFNYEGRNYTFFHFDDGTALEYLSDKVVYKKHLYTIVDQGVSLYGKTSCGRIDAIPDSFTFKGKEFSNSGVEYKEGCEIFPGEEKAYLPPETEKALSDQYKDDLLALVKYYASMKMSKN
jgi:hypothetical protein